MTIKASNYPTVNPTLDLNFAQTVRLDPRVTFSRSSSGTYFDANGVLQTAATNVARFDHNPSTGESLGLLVEEARTNRTVRSQGLGLSTGNWFTNNAFCADNQGLAPDGTFTASRLVPNAVNAIHYVADATGASLSGTATVSVFAKADGYNFILLAFDYASGDGLFPGSAYFDLSTGQIALGASTTGSIQQLTNGWYRCTITATAGSTVQANPFVAAANSLSNFNFAGNGTSGILLWGFQFESGSFPTSYIPTPATFTSRASSATYYDANGVIQTASTNVARSAAFFPDSNGVMRPAGLLLEAAGTNLLQYSEQLNTSPWTLNNSASVSANSSVAPDGQTTADTLSGTTTNSYVEQTIPWSASGNWTLSFFAKAGTSARNKIYIVRSASQVHGTNIDWSSGAPSFSTTFGCTAQSEKIGNGWYRISLLFTSVDHTATNFLRITSDFISGTGTVLLWGFQAEQNIYPTSYIPTTSSTVTRSADVSSSATVTRSADVAQITGTNFSSWFNPNEGAFLANLPINQNLGRSAYVFDCGNNSSGGSGASGYGIYTLSNQSAGGFTQVANSVVADVAVSYTGSRGRIAYGYRLNDFNAAVNGVLGTKDTSGAIPTLGAQQLVIGARFDGTANSCSQISRITYWPTRLSDATLQAITR